MTRDTVLFASGLAGFAYEVALDHTERPTIVIACLTMMGLPAFLRTDERRQAREHEAATDRSKGQS